MKLEHWNYSRRLPHAECYVNPTTWVVWANTKFATVRFLCLFFGLFVTRRGRTSGPILTIYVFPRKDWLLEGFVDMGLKPPPPKKGGARICTFKPNAQNITTYILLKPLCRIQPNFAHCQRPPNDSLWVERPPFKNIATV